jgi:hypothetical protein
MHIGEAERDSNVGGRMQQPKQPHVCKAGGTAPLTVRRPRPINGAWLPTPATLLEQGGKVEPIEANAAS